ncbi:hypothetical protein [Haloferax volcanii]|uniref:hypothetical protein n=1 Tax=Haloferax volcanii TaxID=2246 RepID=UPI00249BC974|nr:hypothetical protein [Haloferax alexandrinus]WEL29857.1 hypothetical protein HBNXHx_1751 [Haloferax alexandrinus]
MSRNTVRVRVAGSQFRYDREQYIEGDELEVHEGALEKHPRTLERVEDADENVQMSTGGEADAADDVDEGGGLTVDDLDPHPEDLTVVELEERIDDVDDVDLLETIKEAEEETENRTGAIDAVENRLDELEG